VEDKQHPFTRLPKRVRQTPEVVDAWLIDLSSSQRGTSGSRFKIDPVLLRGLGLMLMAMTALGIITPEQFIKLVFLLLKALAGG
jgi:hypothetical protein